MNPALSPQITGFLSRALTREATSSRTSGSVTTVRTISTKPCTGAGLKKCTPMTRPGWAFAVEISVTEREEVLVARMVSSATTSSSCLKICFLISIDSTTASTTRSAPLSSSMRGGEGDPLVQRLGIVLAQLAACDRTRRRVLEVLASTGDAVVVDLHTHDGVAVAGEHLRDAGTHGAQSDDADGLEVTCHGAHPATRPRGADCVSAHVVGGASRSGAGGFPGRSRGNLARWTRATPSPSRRQECAPVQPVRIHRSRSTSRLPCPHTDSPELTVTPVSRPGASHAKVAVAARTRRPLLQPLPRARRPHQRDRDLRGRPVRRGRVLRLGVRFPGRPGNLSWRAIFACRLRNSRPPRPFSPVGRPAPSPRRRSPS